MYTFLIATIKTSIWRLIYTMYIIQFVEFMLFTIFNFGPEFNKSVFVSIS
jgi:hypothetical protein